jgi:hypothetical protein
MIVKYHRNPFTSRHTRNAPSPSRDGALSCLRHSTPLRLASVAPQPLLPRCGTRAPGAALRPPHEIPACAGMTFGSRDDVGKRRAAQRRMEWCDRSRRGTARAALAAGVAPASRRSGLRRSTTELRSTSKLRSPRGARGKRASRHARCEGASEHARCLGASESAQ